jgi:hypothetical protein
MTRISIVLALCVSVRASADPPHDVYARVPIEAGPVPGAPELIVHAARDNTHCGGFAVAVVATTKPAGLEPELVAALTIEAPRDLTTLTAWLEASQTKLKAARALLGKRDGADQLAARAREAQVLRWFAQTLVRMEIPRDVRTGDDADDKVKAYCAALDEIAVPVVDRADEAARSCRALATSAGDGWWTQACADRSGQRDAR